MIEELATYLRVSTSSEFEEKITQAIELFDAYGIEDYQTNYLDLLMTSDNKDVTNTQTDIESLTMGYQDTILDQLMVRVGEETSIGQTNLVLMCLKQIEDTEENLSIIAICDQYPDPQEALCEIVSLLTGVTVQNVYTWIEFVDPTVIIAIRRQAQDTMDQLYLAQDAINPQERDYLLRLEDFEKYVGGYAFIIRRYLNEGFQLGLPYSTYYHFLVNTLKQLDPKDMAYELIGISLIASDSQTNPRDIIHQHLNQTFGSISEITAININVEKQLVGYQHYQTSGIKRTQ